MPGIGLFSVLSAIFDLNECYFLSQRKYNPHKTRLPLTDEEIALKIVNEFPHLSQLLESRPYYSTWFPTVNYYRGRYNRGALRHISLPDRVCFRYNTHGQRVSSRSGWRVLTEKEILTTIAQHEVRKLTMPFAKNHIKYTGRTPLQCYITRE